MTVDYALRVFVLLLIMGALAARKLANLLDDPHPGLATWQETRTRLGEDLLSALSYALSPVYLPEAIARVQQWCDGPASPADGLRVDDVRLLLRLAKRGQEVQS